MSNKRSDACRSWWTIRAALPLPSFFRHSDDLFFVFQISPALSCPHPNKRSWLARWKQKLRRKKMIGAPLGGALRGFVHSFNGKIINCADRAWGVSTKHVSRSIKCLIFANRAFKFQIFFKVHREFGGLFQPSHVTDFNGKIHNASLMYP